MTSELKNGVLSTTTPTGGTIITSPNGPTKTHLPGGPWLVEENDKGDVTIKNQMDKERTVIRGTK